MALTTNFRTVPPVLDWVNAVFSELIQAEPRAQPSYQPLDPHRITRPADGLVCRDRYVYPCPHGGEVVDRGGGLLDILESAGGSVERADRIDGSVDVPSTIGIDAYPGSTAEQLPS